MIIDWKMLTDLAEKAYFMQHFESKLSVVKTCSLLGKRLLS